MTKILMPLQVPERNGALDYIEASHATAGYAYGNEWLIYALLHAGREINVNVLKQLL